MRDVVILALLNCLCLAVAMKFSLSVERDVFSLVGETVFGQILVDCQLNLVFLIGVEP